MRWRGLVVWKGRAWGVGRVGGWGVTIGRAGHITRIRSWNKMSWCGWSGSCSAGHTDLLTRVLENTFHIQAISSTGLVVSTPFEIICQLSGSTVVNYPRVALVASVLSANQYEGDVLDISILGHLGVVIVDGVERGLIFQTKHEYHGVHPGGKL